MASASELAQLRQKIDDATEQIDALHNTLEAKGDNSRRVKGLLDGQVFSVPVDSEHKATRMPILNCSNPHMRAFHGEFREP